MKLSEVGQHLVVSDADYQDWIKYREQPRSQAGLNCLRTQFAAAPIKISILFPTYNSDVQFLKEAIDSVVQQIYTNWQLCIVDDASEREEVREILRGYAAIEPRISLLLSPKNCGIAAATNQALKMAAGSYCALMDHDDVMPSHALLCVVNCIQKKPEARLIYSDSDRLDGRGQRVEPFFKPDWNYDLFLGQNYLNHLTVYATDLLRALGGFNQGFEGSQDYELALRALESISEDNIVHIAEILYHWRKVESSFSSSQLAKAARAARRAVTEHLNRRGFSAHVKACPGALLYNQVIWPYQHQPVALVIYGADEKLVRATVSAWQQISTLFNIQWSTLIIDAEDGAKRLNEWAQCQRSEIIGFVSAGFSPPFPQAWDSWFGHSQRTHVDAVGIKYITSTQEVLGPLRVTHDPDSSIGVSCCARETKSSGYFANLVLDRRVNVLQAGCLLFRRHAFREVGGWRHDPMSTLAAGAELTMRLAAGGGSLIWHPFAEARSFSVELDRALRTGADTGIAENEFLIA